MHNTSAVKACITILLWVVTQVKASGPTTGLSDEEVYKLTYMYKNEDSRYVFFIMFILQEICISIFFIWKYLHEL